MLTQLEISFPGSLKLHVIVNESDKFGTSEFSPIEIIQPFILAICGLLMAWIAKYCLSQRPIAFPCGGLALAFIIRELDYFFDIWVGWSFLQGRKWPLPFRYGAVISGKTRC